MNGIDTTAREPERIRRAIADMPESLAGLGFIRSTTVTVDPDFIIQQAGRGQVQGGGAPVLTLTLAKFPPGTGVIGQVLAIEEAIDDQVEWQGSSLMIGTNLQNGLSLTQFTGSTVTAYTVLAQNFLASQPWSVVAGQFGAELVWQASIDMKVFVPNPAPVPVWPRGRILLTALTIPGRPPSAASAITGAGSTGGYFP